MIAFTIDRDGHTPITVTIDEDTDALYVKVNDKPVVTTDHYSDVVNADFDIEQQLVGVEIIA